MLGYAAMNRTLRERDPPRRCNRDMRRALFGKLPEGEIDSVVDVVENFEDHAPEWMANRRKDFFPVLQTRPVELTVRNCPAELRAGPVTGSGVWCARTGQRYASDLSPEPLVHAGE